MSENPPRADATQHAEKFMRVVKNYVANTPIFTGHLALALQQYGDGRAREARNVLIDRHDSTSGDHVLANCAFCQLVDHVRREARAAALVGVRGAYRAIRAQQVHHQSLADTEGIAGRDNDRALAHAYRIAANTIENVLLEAATEDEIP